MGWDSVELYQVGLHYVMSSQSMYGLGWLLGERLLAYYVSKNCLSCLIYMPRFGYSEFFLGIPRIHAIQHFARAAGCLSFSQQFEFQMTQSHLQGKSSRPCSKHENHLEPIILQ